MANNLTVESGTDTDTVSSLGDQEYDYSDLPQRLDRDQTADIYFGHTDRVKDVFLGL